VSQRDRIRMSAAEVAAFLDEQRTMTVATLDAGGWPHLVAMWYVLRDGDVWFWTYGRSQKAVNLRRDPRLTCLIEAGEHYAELRGVSLTGRAALETDPGAVAEVGFAIAARYGGLDDAAVRAQAPKRVAVRVITERTASWDHRKLAV
jgi:PPOX class probable F420-dependent enzyme